MLKDGHVHKTMIGSRLEITQRIGKLTTDYFRSGLYNTIEIQIESITRAKVIVAERTFYQDKYEVKFNLYG